MQCPSCRFENMPGLEYCGRCGTSLGLSMAAVDVSPPRASRAAKRVRRFVPRRLLYEARDVANEARRVVTGSIVNDSHIPLPEPDVLARLMVPGWAHIHAGLRLRGYAFLWAYFLLLLPGLLLWGTDFGSILLGLAFSVHASSVMDILIRQGTVRFPRMMAMAALVSLALAVLFYYPAGQLLMRVAEPIAFATDSPPFKRLDMVLVNRWAFALTAPRRGEVVAFSPLNTSRVRPPANQPPFMRLVYEENQLIDRLIGLPGDRVVWDGGKLSINGTAVSWKPLLFERLPKHLEISVPQGRYLILPTTSAGADNNGGAESFWKTAGLIPEGDILGGAYLRSSPLSRFWFIR
jgi:signal peptidase I